MAILRATGTNQAMSSPVLRHAHQLFKQYAWNGVERIVFWSGGHDSTVALHLALKHWRDWEPHVVFVDTGITLPETLEYVRSTSELMGFTPTILKPTIDFWEYVAKNGFPFFKRLWCRRILKMTPIRRYLNSLPGYKINVLGIRRKESVKRMATEYYEKPFRRHTQLRKTYVLLPILDWSKSQVQKYMRKHDIPENPCYQIYKTSGCYFCPFVTNESHYLALKNRHPELFQNLLDAERSIKSEWSVFKDKPTVEEMARQQFLL
jgi:3'-phosphoadenosine 5'-phosphosulfate sulfotransferase (PAPS reductase)/FAD synthetase